MAYHDLTHEQQSVVAGARVPECSHVLGRDRAAFDEIHHGIDHSEQHDALFSARGLLISTVYLCPDLLEVQIPARGGVSRELVDDVFCSERYRRHVL